MNQFNYNPPINPQQFMQNLGQLNQNTISMLVQQARTQGISEVDIQKGIDFINQMYSNK